MKQSTDFILAKKDQRKLSVFLVRQMLFDYAQGRLDKEREKDVEQYLSEHLELKRDLESLSKAINFCQKINKEKYNLLPEFNDEKRFSLKTFFSKVPAHRWKFRLIFFSVVFLIALFAVDIRMFWTNDNTFIEEEIFKIEQLQESNFKLDKFDIDPVFKSVDLSQYKKKSEKVETSSLKTEETKTEANLQKKVSVKNEEIGKNQDGQLRGLIHRMFMRDKNASKYYQTIVDEIVRLGGTKAGKVKLGWKRKNGYYYHFTLPERHKEGFIRFLKEKSLVKVESHPHKKVMDEGVFRFILWLRKD